jgi:DNA helicase HerA-like ATPase
MEQYSEYLEAEIKAFIESKYKILVTNPEKHYVKKAAGNIRIQELVDLTNVEKTRAISEKVLEYFKKIGESETAKCLIVYEEAHSLIPEWNSVCSPGDSTAANGIAKVILQGRKYGVGCFVITQRTANVTKSILNQCNTIFALRVFDDTGKAFLENYIGKDYSDLLPTLEERYAIAIGKGLMLKQPIIIRVNDKKYLIKR